ncbi:deoxyguanosinetriphosphate triphosphohydrolase [Rickettsiales bacterium]|nr:deoxyguanosinetriphosphate triphosphohydrolase [Rickettsiales bacterium]
MIDFKLTSFATDESKSKGRHYKESRSGKKYRSTFGNDRDRIINSSSFRRLQYKTQVFINYEGDHYRTRLTHSLEVAQIARWIATALKVNKDLAEIISLAHDLGHTPFGHSGEDILNQKMKNFGGFSHNAHTLRILTKFENHFLEFEGLNLSWEMLEGVVKHNGAIKDLSKTHSYIAQYNEEFDLDLSRNPSIEAQISAISDDIAYSNHDIEDALRANLFNIEDLFDLPLIGKTYKNILAKYPDIRREVLIDESKREIVNIMVLDVVNHTLKNIEKFNINSPEDVRNHNDLLVNFSDEIKNAVITLKEFFKENIYFHSKINRVRNKCDNVISKLFDFYIQNPSSLPGEYHEMAKNIDNKNDLAILISDYIAGMTDRYAIREYKELYQF